MAPIQPAMEILGNLQVFELVPLVSSLKAIHKASLVEPTVEPTPSVLRVVSLEDRADAVTSNSFPKRLRDRPEILVDVTTGRI